MVLLKCGYRPPVLPPDESSLSALLSSFVLKIDLQLTQLEEFQTFDLGLIECWS